MSSGAIGADDHDAANGRVAAIGERRGRGIRLDLPVAWWPIAFAHAVQDRPVRAAIGGTALCLYRDRWRTVRAVVDVCPHRRLPLSMGRVTAEGEIQCGYHGWCFDGATGRCSTIPNLNRDERVSPSIKVAILPTAERAAGSHAGTTPGLAAGEALGPALAILDTAIAAGFVHVWTGADGEVARAAPHDSTYRQPPRLCAEFEARVPLALAADVLASSPGTALGLGALLGSGHEVVRPAVDDDAIDVRIRRERRQFRVAWADTFEPPGRHTVQVMSCTSPVTGLTTLRAERDDGRHRSSFVVAMTPVTEYRTVVRWHGSFAAPGRPIRALVAAANARRKDRARRFERVADELAGSTRDPGVLRLRTMRGE